MKENIIYEKITNDKIEFQSNEQLLSMIKKIMDKYNLNHNEILLNYFKDKNVLKVFELNRKRYRYTRDGYLSIRSLTYVLVYFDTLLDQLEQLHKRKGISKIFLDSYFMNENKLTNFCSDISGDVFNAYSSTTYDSIKKSNLYLLTNDFLTGLNKMKLYYNIFFGRANNRYLLNYKNELNKEELKYFICKISKNLKNEEIMFIYELLNKNLEQLTKDEEKVMKNIIKTFNKKDSNIIVYPNFLLEEDKFIISNIPQFFKDFEKEMIFSDFENCNKVINKESIEVYTFQVKVNTNTYDCKIRKLLGALHLYLYDEDKIIYKDRIYFLDDIKRFLIIIKEQNRIKENNYSFWN